MAIITYPEALFEKVVSPEVLAQSRIEIAIGEKLDVDFVIQVLVEYGFERTDFVYEPGQFSIRGGIVDLFSFEMSCLTGSSCSTTRWKVSAPLIRLPSYPNNRSAGYVSCPT